MPPTTTGRIDFGPHQLADHLGLLRGEIDRARELRLLPACDVAGGRWSAAAADRLAGQVEQLRQQLAAEQALGAVRCAARLAELTGLPVAAEDITAPAEQGLLQVADHYKQWPLYRVADVAARAANRELLAHANRPHR